MVLSNRFVRSATWEGMATDSGASTSKLVDLMARLAAGGVGLIACQWAKHLGAEVIAVESGDKTLRAAIERERNRIALAENELRPRLDFGMEVKQPFGSVAEGGESRDETDTVIGFEFTVPLQRRAAQGKLAQAEAELAKAQADLGAAASIMRRDAPKVVELRQRVASLKRQIDKQNRRLVNGNSDSINTSIARSIESP